MKRKKPNLKKYHNYILPVFGQDFLLEVKDLGDDDGLTSVIKKTIEIDSKIDNIEDFNQTVIHELGHAIFHRISVNQTAIHDDVKEIIVDSIATTITELFELSLKRQKKKGAK